ncbi:MAG: prepilin-type N-terminal cleavage/methylation domain-containing protein [Candidatus Sumerlaeia bacterium]|nr:prepilin-type N-terminal cleavage/methylation domain-containing protein [Candidatus Sumerlaeia bacterium]
MRCRNVKKSFSHGFTLIELLIVVAIIAILAAIAVPNFLEAQTRSKVSRAQADMRTLATAIETYYVDNNRYPPMAPPTSNFFGGPGGTFIGPSVFIEGRQTISARFIWLTTPIAYITSVFRDPFIPANVGVALNPDGTPNLQYDTYDYVEARTFSPDNAYFNDSLGRGSALSSGAQWHVVSAGPDLINAFGGGHSGQTFHTLGMDYDPTNGTLSAGDIVRIGGGPGPIINFQPAYNRVTGEWNFPGS